MCEVKWWDEGEGWCRGVLGYLVDISVYERGYDNACWSVVALLSHWREQYSVVVQNTASVRRCYVRHIHRALLSALCQNSACTTFKEANGPNL